MREIFTYGSVGGAPGNRCFYLERDVKKLRSFLASLFDAPERSVLLLNKGIKLSYCPKNYF